MTFSFGLTIFLNGYSMQGKNFKKFVIVIFALLYLSAPLEAITKQEDNPLKVTLDNKLIFTNGSQDIIIKIYSLSDKSLNFVKFTYKGKNYTLPQVVSADGARFSDGRDLSVWLVGRQLNVINNIADNKNNQTYHLKES